MDELKIVIPKGTTNREYYEYLLSLNEKFEEKMKPHISRSYEDESRCQAWWDSEYESEETQIKNIFVYKCTKCKKVHVLHEWRYLYTCPFCQSNCVKLE